MNESSTMRTLLVIPARGGSKRIPGKNIRSFAGKPMIAHSIEKALTSKVVDRLIVSTDSEEIASVAREYGAEVPFMRPAELSDDFAPTGAVVLQAIQALELTGASYQVVGCLYPTAPLLDVSDFIKGHELVATGAGRSAMAVASYGFPIWRAMQLDNDGHLAALWPEYRRSRSQDLPEAYQDTGQFYWADVESFKREGKFLSDSCCPVIIPRYRVQDIDTEEDWERAEIIYQIITGQTLNPPPT